MLDLSFLQNLHVNAILTKFEIIPNCHTEYQNHFWFIIGLSCNLTVSIYHYARHARNANSS